MDAQNAAGSDKPKPVAAAEKRPGNHQPDESKESTNKPPKTAEESIKVPPNLPKDIKPSVTVSRAPPAADDAPAERDSDAETIVLPGKDGHSPSKARKVKHEDRSDGEIPVPRKNRDTSAPGDGDKDKSAKPPRLLSEGASSLGMKKKRLHDQSVRTKDGSSGLSSAPASPPRRRIGGHSDSDTGADRRKSPKLPIKDRAKSTDRTIPHKRKAPKADSEDEAENRKARRQRISDTGIEVRPNRAPKEHKPSSSRRENEGHSGSRTRSVSPHHPRAHRRSISTQLPANSSNGLSHKKKRLPPPLQSTDYHSDESSASGSPHPRSSKLRNLSTPATAESNMSPAKIAPHKKHLDAHGQTFLARACARGEYDIAKQRLGERPEDLNVADYAGNTPLQIAAINGYEDIVKLLIDAGCNLDCVNYDKDTPLLDAVDNGHLGVVKLLLNAGVNPRKANVSGEEPLDRISDDLENAAEFRAALTEAKSRQGERRRTSEDHHSVDHQDGRSSLGPDSPRRSPAPSSANASGRRAGTVRATKTSNYLLYMSLDDKTLRQAAARGDEETVTRILQVKDGCDDSEAMVAAARGGHEVVIQLLLALGGANPDPAPVPSMPPEFATPMLAAIGQENIKVVRLLLDQTNFDPTRRFKGETYHEIARRRQGTNWKDEEHMLKEAYDAYRKSHRDISKTKSPNRRERERERERERDRDQEREAKRQGRHELKEEARAHKRNLSSPSRDPENRKKSASRNITSPKEKRRSDSFHDETSPKRGPGRPRKEDRVPTIAVSDREASPAPSQKQSVKAAKRAESDVAMSSEGEAVKPRRKLISKGELRGEREKNRRASMVSTTSSLKDPSSPRDPKHDDHPEKPKGEPLSEKYHDRTKALKRDESRDRLSVSGDHSSKRHRSSVTPPHSSTGEKEDGEVPTKRRRLDVDGKERRPKSTASPDDPHRLPRDGPPRSKSNLRDHDDSERRPTKAKPDSDGHRRESGKSSNSDKSSIHVKSEDVDIEMPDASDVKDVEDEIRVKKERDDDKQRRLEEKERRKEERRQEERKRREAEAEENRKKEEERRQREADEKKREAEQKKREAEQKEREAEEKRLREEEEAKQREEERKRKAELEKKRQEEEERQRREAEEKKRREEEEKRLREAEEKKRREEEERKRKEEEARKQREEEERLRKEQLEREAAEEARRLKEEEERKERERKERLHREEMERKRAAKEAEQRRIQQEQERLRLAKLPPLLRWLDGCPNPKSPELAAKFKHMQGVRYDTIRPQASGTPDGREQWILNTHAALLLGEKDLTLSRYTAWEHVPVSDLAKKVLWRLEADRYALITETLYELGAGLPAYYGEGQDPFKMNYRLKEKLRGEAREKFLKLDMFFVKVSDFMFITPSIPHLRNLKMSVEYRELPENEGQLYGWKVPEKWRQDPDADRFYGFAPRNKYYINGVMVEEQKPGLSATSSTPFPEKRVPRKGLQQIFPGDPDYPRLCKEQGLEHLLNGTKSPVLPNGGHLSPRSQSNATETSAEPVNGNHNTAPLPALVPATEARPLPNGVNGIATSGSS
ncbi:histone deacetylase complex subunit [Colletotrichum karsti]|uniref:Histone deacetylase complex subunit n=1 Tax=Colletotrichum karsti TaxID=1095194 RepID=A0A9P6HX41_9PEZI|nr:histone deacetylase complex subunit [Colletotrichum karsti]KAF9871715.1 histone deacetylase complex subunit [Colletotrichum karsti]